MIEVALYALIREDVQGVKERMSILGCTAVSYTEEHVVFVHEEKRNLRCRTVTENGSTTIKYHSPPDSNASRICTVQTIESAKIESGAAQFLKTMGYGEEKRMLVRGFRGELDDALVDCFCIDGADEQQWVMRVSIGTDDGGKVELLEQRLHLYAQRYLGEWKFYHPEPASYCK